MIEMAFGGNTSIDIYPKGWNKTYALNHLKGKDVWFVGDNCKDDGNDKALYDKLSHLNRSYETTGPQETIRLITEENIPYLS